MNIVSIINIYFTKKFEYKFNKKCDKPAMVKEDFESDHPIMNHIYCTATLSTVATGPIQIKTPLS